LLYCLCCCTAALMMAIAKGIETRWQLTVWQNMFDTRAFVGFTAQV